MKATRAVGAGLLALALSGVATAGTATAAQSEPPGTWAGSTAGAAGTSAAPHDCPYPYVCLYKNGQRIGQFQDVTSGYQNLPSRPSGPNLRLVNTRNDDVVWVRYSTGSTICLKPKADVVWETSASTLTGIRISTSATCSV